MEGQTANHSAPAGKIPSLTMDNLSRAFSDYLSSANRKLAGARTVRHRGALSLLPHPRAEIVSAVSDLEESNEFQQLVRSTKEFSNRISRLFSHDATSSKPISTI